MIDRDIWIAANEVIKLYGDEAVIFATLRADTLQALRDEQGYAIWKRIIRAINELRSAEPSGKAH